jgi:hypothetical protein
MDDSWVLIDANSGLHVSWYFWLRVLDEVNRAARYGAPFGLLLLYAEVAPGKSSRLIDDAPSYVPASIRGTDLGGVLGRGAAAVLLTHQDAAAAERARLRVLERLTAACPPGIRWRTELLSYPENGAEISHLLTGGWQLRPWVRAPSELEPSA